MIRVVMLNYNRTHLLKFSRKSFSDGFIVIYQIYAQFILNGHFKCWYYLTHGKIAYFIDLNVCEWDLITD